MLSSPTNRTDLTVVAMTWSVLFLMVGCREAEQFSSDLVWAEANNLTASQTASIENTLVELFGNPDEPRLPPGECAKFLEINRLEQASGKVISEEVGITQGLYGRHCARCHGITGDGRGPTALYQSPYPRDFRRGIFKWKSTVRSAKPTDANLLHTLEHGVAGTSMPSFKLLTEEERKTLIQYVKYLSLRGELEQELITYVAEDLDIDQTLELDDPQIQNILNQLADNWIVSESEILPIDNNLLSNASTERGKAIYASEKAGCVKCHGKDGNGLGVADTDYDVWNKRLFDLNIDADESLKALLNKDLPPRTSVGKRLAESPLRGGNTTSDLYRRIHQGINGSPMPALGSTSDSDQGALSEIEIADLTAYVGTLVLPSNSEESNDE